MSAERTSDMTAPDVEQPTKRVKLDASTSSRAVEGVINPELLNSDTCSRLAEDYRASQPYTHCVMKEVFEVNLLRQVREEIIHNINATYKETDLFKVFQTGNVL